MSDVAALALTEPQRVAPANELVLSVTDPGCLLAPRRLSSSAVAVKAELAARAFIDRDKRRMGMPT